LLVQAHQNLIGLLSNTVGAVETCASTQ